MSKEDGAKWERRVAKKKRRAEALKVEEAKKRERQIAAKKSASQGQPKRRRQK